MTELDATRKQGLSGLQVFAIVSLTILVTAGFTYWVLSTYIFAKEFKTVTLSSAEEQVLEEKLQVLGLDLEAAPTAADADEFDSQGNLQPQRYSEEGARRDVSFSERELNALLANNTDLARKVAIKLSDDLVSARMLMPMDPDFPILGGKTLRASAGVELAYREGRPVVIIKGVSIWGVPVPNAWLGNVKNIDLVGEFGADRGFWKSFADGVQNIRVEDGQLRVQLKE
jgi:hypothetical protein